MNSINRIDMTVIILVASTATLFSADIQFEKERFVQELYPSQSEMYLPSDVMVCITHLCTRKDQLTLRATCNAFANAYLFVRKNDMSFDLTLEADRFENEKSQGMQSLLLKGVLQIDDHITLEPYDSAGFKLFCGALAHCTKLYLGSNDIGADGVRHIADVLKINSALRELNLRSNNIGDGGAGHIADVLKINSALTVLNLGGNDIGAEGARHIADVLKVNSALTKLYLWDNNIGNHIQLTDKRIQR